jgi:hypothetical protein
MEYLVGCQTKQLGNWTLGQILMHLATVYEKSMDGTGFKPGWLLRYMGKVVVPFWKHWVVASGHPSWNPSACLYV